MATKTFDAIHEIHLTQTPGKAGDRSKGIAPTPPEVKIIKAKTRFTLDDKDDRIPYLMDAGAIRESDTSKDTRIENVSPAKKAPVKKAAPAKKPAADKEPSGDGAKGENKDDLV